MDPAAADPDRYRFPFPVAPIDRHEHLLHQQLRGTVLDDAERDVVRETLFGMVWRVVRAGYAAAGVNSTHRTTTVNEHREAVDAVRAELNRDLAARLLLDDLASAVHLSPFHLSRVFRQQTGQSIHAYRTDIRLRASLELIASGAGLADVALDTGFASHAHLSDRFRRAYGLTPQSWRDALNRGDQMSTIMEARRGATPVA